MLTEHASEVGRFFAGESQTHTTTRAAGMAPQPLWRAAARCESLTGDAPITTAVSPFLIALPVAVAIGAWFGRRALPIAPVGALAAWLAGFALGKFAHDDAHGVSAAFTTIALVIVGIAAVAVGALARSLTRRLRR
jgi:hypothetical protein